MTSQQMQEHVLHLAQSHNVELIIKEGASGRAWRKLRCIRISPVRSGATYAVALHELGHVLGRYPRTRLEKEVAAWEWAKANSPVWTPYMEATLQKRLGSYRRWADRRNGRALLAGRRPAIAECPALDAMLGGRK